jgi:ribokinase
MSADRQEPVIAVVGSLNIDLIAYAKRVPGAGETVIGERFQMGFGGKGANQAVMAARLGGRVSMIGALGDDVYADMTFDNLDKQGVDATNVARVEGSSGVAPIWVEPDGTNRIIVVGGANDLVDPEAAAEAIRSLDGLEIVVGQLEIPQPVTAAAFGAARERGIWTILNPAPAAQLIPELIEASDYLIPNEHELGIVAGRDSIDFDDDDVILEIAESLGVRLIVTLGARGAAMEADGVVYRVPAEPVQAVDTTGAGDAFVGAFAYGLAAGYDELSSVRLGVLCASDSVTKPGTQSSFASREEAAMILARFRDVPRVSASDSATLKRLGRGLWTSVLE